MYYLYDSHLGDLFIKDRKLSPEEQYCNICNDYDSLIGTFETVEDVWLLLKDDCDIDGCGGISLHYVLSFLCEHFSLPEFDVSLLTNFQLSDTEILSIIDKYKDVKYVEQ